MRALRCMDGRTDGLRSKSHPGASERERTLLFPVVHRPAGDHIFDQLAIRSRKFIPSFMETAVQSLHVKDFKLISRAYDVYTYYTHAHVYAKLSPFDERSILCLFRSL